RRRASKGVIHVEDVRTPCRLTQRPVNFLSSPANTIDVNDTCRGVRIRAESQRVHRIGKPSARPADGFRQRGNTALGTHKYVIETPKGMNPVFVQGYTGGPHLLNPA